MIHLQPGLDRRSSAAIRQNGPLISTNSRAAGLEHSPYCSSSCETFSPPACSLRRTRPKGVNSNTPRMRSSKPRYRIHPRLEHLPTGPESSAQGPGTSCFMSLISFSRGRRSFPDIFIPQNDPEPRYFQEPRGASNSSWTWTQAAVAAIAYAFLKSVKGLSLSTGDALQGARLLSPATRRLP